MKTEKFELSEKFPVSASILYNAWLNSKEHAEFTRGGKASIHKKVGSKFKVWDEYISGEILELEEGKRILHSWRTTEFPEEVEDSLLEIILKDINGETLMTMIHSDIPDGKSETYKEGWDEFYFQPMIKYFKELNL